MVLNQYTTEEPESKGLLHSGIILPLARDELRAQKPAPPRGLYVYINKESDIDVLKI
jgi:hypothetical protein